MEITTFLGLLWLLSGQASMPADGNAEIRGEFAGSDIVITTTDRLAGAIHSVKWNGREFIDSTDHGRQLQSAANFDAGAAFIPEVFNPTEAGSRRDGAGPRSSSRLLRLTATDNRLETTTQMAFWLRPGEKSAGHAARNRKILSRHLLRKSVVIGVPGHPNVIDYRVTFTVPSGEQHRYAQFEAVTGYMPPEFSRFMVFDPNVGMLKPLSDGPGEQPFPVVFATADGRHAMAVYSPNQPSAGYENAGYGRFRFVREQVVKWNCVFRLRASADPQAEGTSPENDGLIRSGDYSFRCYVVIGSVEDVAASLKSLVSVENTD